MDPRCNENVHEIDENASDPLGLDHEARSSFTNSAGLNLAGQISKR